MCCRFGQYGGSGQWPCQRCSFMLAHGASIPSIPRPCRNINQLQDAWFSDQLAVRQKVGLLDEPVAGVVSGQVVGAVLNRIAWHAQPAGNKL